MYKYILPIFLFLTSVGLCGGPPVSSGAFHAPPNFGNYQARPNIYHGYNIYQHGKVVGQSRPNIYGGYNYYQYDQRRFMTPQELQRYNYMMYRYGW